MQLTCINCPRGCQLNVEEKDGNVVVVGNMCFRGETYAINELKNPLRTLTTTIEVASISHNRLAVISDKPLPKGLIMEAIKELKTVKVTTPIKMGEIIVENILNSGCNIIASRSIDK